ncbi:MULTISPECIES: LexA family transcriptional regulator [unclassified Pseudoalteromonas]|uniref:LexA family protein n=1 Tax=unclassified Pseudoalteromonas TaxID=194690 RepID=UPI0015FD8135|nr:MULTISPECIES: S24 family peptidase [unclassified Pseudoalteromonas]MBB1291017.1 S24 family peptidase [Pseudoalteromonas sp. SR41-5]MBB1415281.1 S24 family peptidase [Pseudoalteromonas sp. SG43-8]
MLESNVITAENLKDLPHTLDSALLNDTSTFIGRASGHSMQGVGIFDGDLLIIDRALKPKQNDVIVAVLNGLFVCKLADIKNNQLLSANDDYPPVNISDYDSFTLEGVVSQSIRLHKKPVNL